MARDSSPPDHKAPGLVLGCAIVIPDHGLPSKGQVKGEGSEELASTHTGLVTHHEGS